MTLSNRIMDAKRKKLYPKHAFKTAHAFKSEKRRHVREALKAVEQLRVGCAYFPETEHGASEILGYLETLKQALSVRVWGR